MIRCKPLWFAAVTAVSFLILQGCSDPEVSDLNQVERSDETDAGDFDVEVDDINDDANVDGAGERREPRGPEDFEKPPEQDYHYDWQAEYRFDDEFESPDHDLPGNRRGFGPRPYTRFSETVAENWIYDDEFLIFDGYVFRFNYSHLPTDYEIFAVHNGQRLPMRFVEVTEEDGFPSVEEVEQWSEDKFTDGHVTHMENEKVFNYSIVIPPWAFPEKAAYDIQILFRPIREPNLDPGGFLGSPHILSQSTTVYVGSELYASHGEEVDNRQDESEEVDLPIASQATWTNRGMFLAPSVDVYDWQQFDDREDLEMAGVFEVPDDQVTVEYYAAEFKFGMHYYNLGTKLHYVLQDGEIIDQFLYAPQDPEDSLYFGRGTVERLTFDIDLPESGTTQVEVVAVAFPYQPYRKELVEELDETPPPLPPFPPPSNILIFEQVDD